MHSEGFCCFEKKTYTRVGGLCTVKISVDSIVNNLHGLLWD